MSGRIAVLGDVGGWAHRLEVALTALGANVETGRMPDDLVVVQVGDLVHKGPDSTGAVTIADRFLSGSPGRWVQLLGNHEAQYLGGSDFWRPALPEHIQSDLRRWVAYGEAMLAAAIETTELGPVLVSHAGMTRTKWNAIGAPPDPPTAAKLLNSELDSDPELAFAAGHMLDVEPEFPVGVAWASPAMELLKSWEGQELPFTMVHGHASPRHWNADGWDHAMSPGLRRAATADAERRVTRVFWPNDHQIIGIDPGYGSRNAAVPLAPLLLTGTVSR